MYMHLVCVCFMCESLRVCLSAGLCLRVFMIYLHGCVYKREAWQRDVDDTAWGHLLALIQRSMSGSF